MRTPFIARRSRNQTKEQVFRLLLGYVEVSKHQHPIEEGTPRRPFYRYRNTGKMSPERFRDLTGWYSREPFIP
ncbi:MAG: hypothetical protein HQL75_13845 [Magnetococcales bacterium]|nr:hypothetical protein [Magnetococcales bacterium]